jgi:hypothetical protein
MRGRRRGRPRDACSALRAFFAHPCHLSAFHRTPRGDGPRGSRKRKRSSSASGSRWAPLGLCGAWLRRVPPRRRALRSSTGVPRLAGAWCNVACPRRCGLAALGRRGRGGAAARRRRRSRSAGACGSRRRRRARAEGWRCGRRAASRQRARLATSAAGLRAGSCVAQRRRAPAEGWRCGLRRSPRCPLAAASRAAPPTRAASSGARCRRRRRRRLRGRLRRRRFAAPPPVARSRSRQRVRRLRAPCAAARRPGGRRSRRGGRRGLCPRGAAPRLPVRPRRDTPRPSLRLPKLQQQTHAAARRVSGPCSRHAARIASGCARRPVAGRSRRSGVRGQQRRC